MLRIRTRLAAVLFGAAAVSLTALGACVSDSKTGPNPGELGGPCLSNGTCNAGLSCAIVGSSTQCEAPDGASVDGGVDAAPDQAANDASKNDAPSDASDAAAETGPTCDAGITSNFTCAGSSPVGCYDFTSSAHQCMASSNACLNSSYTTPIVVGCFSTSDCKSATPWCCAGTVVTNLTGCPGAMAISANGGMTCSSTPCSGTGSAALCDGMTPCPNGHACIPVNVSQPPGLQGQIFGVCAP